MRKSIRLTLHVDVTLTARYHIIYFFSTMIYLGFAWRDDVNFEEEKSNRNMTSGYILWVVSGV